MEDYRRSRSYNPGQYQIQVRDESPAAPAMPPPPGRFYYYRSYSATSYSLRGYGSKGIKEKAAAPAPSSPSASMKGASCVIGEPEFQRRKRVAGYKAYAGDGRMKGSMRKSFRWLKDRYAQILRGWQ